MWSHYCPSVPRKSSWQAQQEENQSGLTCTQVLQPDKMTFIFPIPRASPAIWEIEREKKNQPQEPFQAWEMAYGEKGAEGALNVQLSTSTFQL